LLSDLFSGLLQPSLQAAIEGAVEGDTERAVEGAVEGDTEGAREGAVEGVGSRNRTERSNVKYADDCTLPEDWRNEGLEITPNQYLSYLERRVASFIYLVTLVTVILLPW